MSLATSSMFMPGEKVSGMEVRKQNVQACMGVANIIRSSFGPNGLDKMLVDEIGDITVTNDGATIMSKLDVEHPAAKILVGLSQRQDDDVGDGTTSVVLLGAELIKRGTDLISKGVHPTVVINGFTQAAKIAREHLRKVIAVDVESLGRDVLKNIAKTSISSKIIGAQHDHFAELVVEAVLAIKTENMMGKAVYPVNSINVLKAPGASISESFLVDGFALNCTRASQQMPRKVQDARIAILDFDLQKHRMGLGVEVNITNPDELEAVKKREYDITKEKIGKIIDAGANVILTTKGIDDMAAKYLIERGVMGVRRCLKSDLKRIAAATGGEVVTTLASFDDEEGGEHFDPMCLGKATMVEEARIGDDELIYVHQSEATPTPRRTLIIRGANPHIIDEVERSIHDALCVVSRTLENRKVAPGGGAVEAALAARLEAVALETGGAEQSALVEFANALMALPATLAVNSARDGAETVARLRALHRKALRLREEEGADSTEALSAMHHGLALTNIEDSLISGEGAELRDNIQAGVLEPALNKRKLINSATEAAVTILRVDTHIQLQQRKEQQ